MNTITRKKNRKYQKRKISRELEYDTEKKMAELAKQNKLKKEIIQICKNYYRGNDMLVSRILILLGHNYIKLNDTNLKTNKILAENATRKSKKISEKTTAKKSIKKVKANKKNIRKKKKAIK